MSTFRKNLIDVLKTLSSKELQNEYQKNVSYISVPDELVCKWFDDFFIPKSELVSKNFTDKEISDLQKFNDEFDKYADNLSQDLNEYQVSKESDFIANAANEVLKKNKW